MGHDLTVLYIKEPSQGMAYRLKAASALERQSLTNYLHPPLEIDVFELGRKNVSPKPEGQPQTD